MKKINFTFKLALPFLILIFAAGLAYDLFKFYSSVSILYLDYLSELSMVLFGFILSLIIHKFPFRFLELMNLVCGFLLCLFL